MRLARSALAAALLAACSSEHPPAPPSQLAPPTSGPSATAAAQPPGVPVTGHPRLWITAADLPRLRGWAGPANPLYVKGLRPAVEQAIAVYDKDFFPGGKPNPAWPDPGIDNWVQKPTEAYAEIFAFMSLVDPDPAARAAHAARARNLLMHVMDEAVKGADPNRQSPAPFRSGAFATYNRANYWGEGFGLTVDWIYPALTAADKATIRKVFMRWGDESVHAATSGDEHPEPIDVVNDPRLLADRRRLRWAANNYYTGHMRQMVLTALALDDADDPPLDPAAPHGKLGNTLRSYLDDAVGAWLYQQYAVYEDPETAAAALGVPAAGLGAASGGLSPEGFLYGASLGALHEALLGLYTAGYRDPRLFGPQIRLVESGYWDRVVDGFLHSLTPAPVTHGHEGPVYEMANYGDTLRFWMTPDQARVFASIAIHDMSAGNRARLAKARWIAAHAVQGGADRLFERVARIWGNGEASSAILHFLAFDPAEALPPDPRPGLPLVFHDRALGRVIARTNWTPNATLFDYKCSWSTIGHQLGDANQIELYRKGEWLIKERSGYANDLVVATPDYHDTLSIQNTASSGAARPAGLQWFEEVTWARGGQWALGASAGDPSVRASAGAGWVVAQGDATNLYNRAHVGRDGQAVDVLQASRGVAWIEPDQLVVYDRAVTKTDGRFKRFNLTFVGEPVVQGRRATVTTPHGQKLFVETLLPAGATLTASKAEDFQRVAEGEPTRFRLVVEDPRGPREVRFLHVLEGADAGGSPSATAVVRSSAGTAFEGAVVGGSAVLFPVDAVDAAAAFTGVTYTVPATVKGQLVTGLTPGGAYEVTLKPAGGGIEVTVAPGGARHADEAGVLALGALETRPAP